MFNVNQTVAHDRMGICKITDVRSESFGGVKQEYYILTQLDGEHSTIYVPVVQETNNIRTLLDEHEVQEIIKDVELSDWTENRQMRKEKFKQILSSGDYKQISSMIITLHNKKNELQEAGKKFYVVDEHQLKIAESLVLGEFAFVLNKKKEEVLEAMLDNIQTAAC